MGGRAYTKTARDAGNHPGRHGCDSDVDEIEGELNGNLEAIVAGEEHQSRTSCSSSCIYTLIFQHHLRARCR